MRRFHDNLQDNLRLSAIIAMKSESVGFPLSVRIVLPKKELEMCVAALFAFFKKTVLVIVGSLTVDCSQGEVDPMTNAFIQMSGVFAELELRIIRQRVRSSMANAKAKGAQIGRPKATADDIPRIFYRHYPSYKNGQLNLSEFARVCGMSRTTIYKYCKMMK